MPKYVTFQAEGDYCGDLSQKDSSFSHGHSLDESELKG